MEISRQNAEVGADVTLEETIKALNEKLFDSTIIMENIVEKLEKAMTLLNCWTQEYLYCEKPDPRAAIAYGSSKGKGQHYEQSAQWYMEYEKITQFIEIVYDYVHESKEVLRKVVRE